jgi:hypothetical protein
MEIETTDVIICGCGPTGAMLSGYLGRLSVNIIVLEKELEITQDPEELLWTKMESDFFKVWAYTTRSSRISDKRWDTSISYLEEAASMSNLS